MTPEARVGPGPEASGIRKLLPVAAFGGRAVRPTAAGATGIPRPLPDAGPEPVQGACNAAYRDPPVRMLALPAAGRSPGPGTASTDQPADGSVVPRATAALRRHRV